MAAISSTFALVIRVETFVLNFKKSIEFSNLKLIHCNYFPDQKSIITQSHHKKLNNSGPIYRSSASQMNQSLSLLPVLRHTVLSVSIIIFPAQTPTQ